MKTSVFLALSIAFALPCLAGTITYTYDAQHRLVQASYSASEKVFYNYDAAGNVDQHVTITDVKHLENWLLYLACHSFSDGGFSLLDTVYPAPLLGLRSRSTCEALAKKVGEGGLVPWETTLLENSPGENSPG